MLALIGLTIIAFSSVQTQTALAKHYQSKLSDKQIIRNLRVIKSTNPTNNAWTKYYRSLLQSKRYSFTAPYIKLNPYGTAPLTALMIFNSPKPTQVSYTVQGKSPATNISNTVSGYQSQHQVPIIGLYADYKNVVTVTLKYQDGSQSSKNFTITTAKLPATITDSQIKVQNVQTNKMDLGANKLTVLARTSRPTFAVDANGEVRWYYLRWNEHLFKQLRDGHLLLVNKTTGKYYRYNLLMETDYLGRIYREYHFDQSLNGHYGGKGISVVHHDTCELSNGNLLLTVSDGSKYVEDTVAELNRKSGKITKVIDFKKIFPASMYQKCKIKAGDDTIAGMGLLDWLHINAIDYDAATGNLLVSARNQDMIWAINYQNRKLQWIFSSKKASSWPKTYRKYLLKPLNGAKYTGGQHGLYLLRHNGSKVDVLLYDNNIAVTYGDKRQSGKYSAATEYEIDPAKKTIKQLWSYGKNLGAANFTKIIGNAQRLTNGNTLIDFGFKNNGRESNVIEVTPNGEQVFNLTTFNKASDKTYVYRAYRMSFYPNNYHFDLNK